MPKYVSQSLIITARAVLLGTLLLVVLSAVLRVFDSSHPGDYGEGPILAMVQRVRAESVSADWLDGPPYTLSCYGPGYYEAVGAATAVLPWDRTLLPGRLVSLLATLAVAALVGLAVGRSSGSIDLAVAGAMIFLVSPIVHAWGIPHRVDALALLFAVGAYLAVSVPRAGLVASAFCVVIGSLVKPTVALTAVPIFCYLLSRGRYKAAAGYAALVAVLGAAAWGALDRLSGGYFLATAVRGNVGAMLPQQGFWYGHAFLSMPLGAVAAVLVGYRFVRRPAAAFRSLWCLGFVLSAAIATLFSAKEGAAPNYFLEASALGTLVIGCHGLAPLWSRQRGRTLAVLALLALIVAAPEIQRIRQRGFELDFEPFGASLVAERLGTAPDGLVLADGQLIPAVIHAGRNPAVNDPFVFRLLVDQGRLDATPLVEAMQRGDVQHLVLKQSIETHREHLGRTSQKWPVEILDAMDAHYVPDTAADQVHIYRHRRARP